MSRNTAVFICATFVFKILFFSLLVSSSTNSDQTTIAVKTNFPVLMKRRVNFEATGTWQTAEYSFAETREEEEKSKDSQSEVNPFFLIQALNAVITRETNNKLKPIAPFRNYLSDTSSQRYLVLQVFRT